ncbi:MAG: carbon monoxide dehydrogenase [Dehalococcoidia bacterium]|nr:carbon monoxide dehydrogenase [Dehalococcoidia bacterium]
MKNFQYSSPLTLDQALQHMDSYGSKAKALAGGTDILVQLRGNRFDIEMLVDVKSIPELNELSYTVSEGLSVGAAVPCIRIYEDSVVQQSYPCLVDAAFLIGGIQIQSRATIGGNLCNASPSGDTIPALIALEAEAVVFSKRGYRSIPVEDFCVGPGQNGLQDGELLVSIKFPPPKLYSGAHFLRFIPRNEMDIAVANVGVALTLDSKKQTVESARIALGAVGPTPLLATKASEFLVGKEISDDSLYETAEIAKQIASPITDMRGTINQRIHLVGVLTRRALQKAVERAKGV